MSNVRRWLRLLLLMVLARVGRWWVLRRACPAGPRRILLIKPDHLGDMLLCTPALHLLRQRFPQAHIVMLAGPWSAFLLQDNHDIDALLTLPFPGFARGAAVAGPLQPYAVLLRAALLLRAGRFDAVLLLRDDHWWGAALALLAGIPRRVGYAVPECRPFLSHALPWQPSEHVTRQALALVAALAGSAEAAPWQPEAHPLCYAPPPDALQWAAAWLAAQGVGAGERLVIVHAGTGGAAKLWLPERWAAVADALACLPGVRLLLTGGPGEEAQVAALARRLHRPPLVLAGTASVGQLVALLGRAALVLGVDSGPLHLAVSQGTPSLHLFGPSDAERFGPWGADTRHIVLRAGLWCSPCGVFAACPRHTDPPECMQHITVAHVLAQARRLLALAE